MRARMNAKITKATKIKAESASRALISLALLGRMKERLREAWLQARKKSPGTRIKRKMISPRRRERSGPGCSYMAFFVPATSLLCGRVQREDGAQDRLETRPGKPPALGASSNRE